MTFRILRTSLVFVFLFAGTCLAQTSTSQVSGTVRDASGAVVPRAAVTLTNEATAVAQRHRSRTLRVSVYSRRHVLHQSRSERLPHRADDRTDRAGGDAGHR
jgi:hypothetical protein